jgi:hypothetical protein
MLTTLAPPFYDPEYEEPADGCELQARWPGLVGTARSSSVASELPVFYEWAPLPGGLLLAGVGHARRSRDRIERSLRETILARMLAGHSLEESVRSAFTETGADLRAGSVCYALVDPIGAKVETVRDGPHVSLIHVAGGVARPLCHASTIETGAQTFELKHGDALLFVAHPTLWEGHLFGIVDRRLHQEGDGWSEPKALRLCGEASTLFEGDSSSVLLYRTPPSEAPEHHPVFTSLGQRRRPDLSEDDPT